ncbi:MAG: aminoacyl-tRNA hydrolase [Syntrophales bacterium]|nr:aminoacyl-tRNA hydrolase [Syntrophales bacterium]
MKLVVGLGNPGLPYALTRHNLGAIVLDRLAEITSLSLSRRGHEALYASGYVDGVRLMLARPETYMNLSGVAVDSLARYYKIDTPDIIVIHDDLDLPFGDVRIKEGGGDGGHKGLISIIYHIGSPAFTRIRCGIGRPAMKEMTESYVLERLNDEEMKEVPRIAEKGSRAVMTVITSGTVRAMNEFNVRGQKNSDQEV